MKFIALDYLIIEDVWVWDSIPGLELKELEKLMHSLFPGGIPTGFLTHGANRAEYKEIVSEYIHALGRCQHSGLFADRFLDDVVRVARANVESLSGSSTCTGRSM